MMLSRFTLTGLLLAAVAAGCSRQAPENSDKIVQSGESIPVDDDEFPGADTERDPREVVARVDRATLTWGDMERRARTFYIEESRSMVIPQGREREAMEFFRRRAIEVFIFKTVMLDEARKRDIAITSADRKEGLARLQNSMMKRRGIDADTFFRESPFGEEAARKEFEEGLYVDKLLKQEVEGNIKLTDVEVDVMAETIIKERKEAREKIDGLRQELLAEADFAALARRHSDCRSSRRGGLLGRIKRGELPEPLDKAVFSQPIGEVGAVVEGPRGYHIFRVEERTPAREASGGLPAGEESAQVRHILVEARPIMTRLQLSKEAYRTQYNERVRAFYAALKQERRIESIFPDMVH